jgi:hypothetical protein
MQPIASISDLVFVAKCDRFVAKMTAPIRLIWRKQARIKSIRDVAIRLNNCSYGVYLTNLAVCKVIMNSAVSAAEISPSVPTSKYIT